MPTNNTTTTSSRTVQASWLALADLLSLSIGLITAAILSRYMTTAEYGTYRQIIYVYTTLLLVFSLGMPNAYSYFLAKAPIEEGRDIVRRLTMIFMCLAIIFSSVLFFGADIIASILDNRLLTVNLKYFAITPILLMPVIGVKNILIVYGMSKTIIIYAISGNLFTIVCTVIPVVIFSYGTTGAVIGFVASSFATCIIGLYISVLPFKNINSRNSNLATKDIFNFSLPIFTSNMYGLIITSASPFFVSRYFGVDDFATYANGYRELPFASMVILPTARILLPEFSRMSKSGIITKELVILWKNVIFKSAAIIYPLTIFSCLFATEIMSSIYGDKYSDAAPLFIIATLVNFIRIVPYMPIMLALGKGRQFANSHLFTAILLVGLDILSIALFPTLTSIAVCTTLSRIICFIILITLISKVLNTKAKDIFPWGDITKFLWSSVAACIVARIIVCHLVHINVFATLILGFIISGILYFVIQHYLGVSYSTILKPLLSALKKQKNSK
ncbi:oligosaccharide flippase family protein [uncultured Muribaculum sp.]|uniref:lipopolysaccharide biosynthesis protein n=1 Tax=uncultured Muribaculum sp. TaxID=1918613 RepID=UPI0025AFB012|nr:oligosaccharide flippase family protein [uncultured Muribaculum sp.]